MKSRVRYACRTLVGPWLLVPAIGLELVAFLQHGMPWRGEGMWTVDYFAIPLLIIGPLSAGVAAVDAARLSRPGNIHLVLAVPWSARVHVRAALWTAGPLMLLHLVTIACAVVIGQVRQPSIGWLAMVVAALVQAEVILWFAAVGSLVGRFVNPLLAGLVAGVGTFLLIYVIGGPASGGFRLLEFGGATVTMLGKAYSSAYLVSQATIFLVTSILFLVLPFRMRSGYRIPTATGAVAGVIAIVALVVLSGTLPPSRTVADPQPPDFCRGTKPQVCLFFEHRRYADLIYPKVEILSQAALESGYSAFVPDRIVEQSRTYFPGGPGVRSLWLPTSVYEEGAFPIEKLAYYLLQPMHCGWFTSPTPPPPEFNRVFFSLLATWLHVAGQDITHAPVAHQILTPDEVQRYLDDFARCDLAALS